MKGVGHPHVHSNADLAFSQTTAMTARRPQLTARCPILTTTLAGTTPVHLDVLESTHPIPPSHILLTILLRLNQLGSRRSRPLPQARFITNTTLLPSAIHQIQRQQQHQLLCNRLNLVDCLPCSSFPPLADPSILSLPVSSASLP